MLNENNRSIMEREAVTRKIRAEWISRIFFDEDIFRLDVLQNPQTPIGAYSNAHPDRSELVNHREWMFNERVEETLPVSLVTKTE